MWSDFNCFGKYAEKWEVGESVDRVGEQVITIVHIEDTEQDSKSPVWGHWFGRGSDLRHMNE